MTPRKTPSVIAAFFIALLVTPVFGQLTWKQKTIALSLVEGQQGTQVEFSYSNETHEVVEITRITPSCTCTVAGEYTKFVAPGKSGSIKFFFHPGERTGLLKQTIKLETGKSTTDLNIDADVLEWASITPRLLVWQRTAEINPQTIKVVIADGIDASVLPPQVEGATVKVDKSSPGTYLLQVIPISRDKPISVSVPIYIQRNSPDVTVVRNAFIVVR